MMKYFVVLYLFMTMAFFSYAQESKPKAGVAVTNEQQAAIKDASIYFTVLDMADKPRASAKITITGQKTKRMYTATTDANGKVTVIVPKGDSYAIRYGSVEHNPITIPEDGSGKYEYTIKSEPEPQE